MIDPADGVRPSTCSVTVQIPLTGMQPYWPDARFQKAAQNAVSRGMRSW